MQQRSFLLRTELINVAHQFHWGCFHPLTITQLDDVGRERTRAEVAGAFDDFLVVFDLRRFVPLSWVRLAWVRLAWVTGSKHRREIGPHRE
jgi:hypothetical protein